MTTVSFIKKECFACGKTSRQVEPGIRAFGEPEELDLRPGSVHRSAIYMYIQRCLHCDYCAPNIKQGTDKVYEIVRSDDYRFILKREDLPDTAVSFLCWALIQQSSDNIVDAGWATLYAAWVCDDDSRYKERAIELRFDAYNKFMRARSESMPFARTENDEEIVMVDLLRRSNHFDEALSRIRELLTQDWDTRTKQVLMFEEELCENRDNCRHLFSEAVEEMD